MLCSMSKYGELVRMYYPNLDFSQHIDSFKIFLQSDDNIVSIDDENLKFHQYYNTNILKTEVEGNGFRLILTDFVPINEEAVIRRIEIENTSDVKKEFNVFVYSKFTTNLSEYRSSMFDFSKDCIISYKHDSYICVSANYPVRDFQIGNNPLDAIRENRFYGADDIGMTGEAAQAFNIGGLEPYETKIFELYISPETSLKDSLKKLIRLKNIGTDKLLEDTTKYYSDFLENLNLNVTLNKELDEIYKRSLLVFKLMSDRERGGILASMEVDEEFTRCGRYGYCWGRDAGFITSALDLAKMYDLSEKFYEFTIKTQLSDGSWQQRYELDGNLAPCWGIQIDETGTILWGILNHYKKTGNLKFLSKMWETVKKAADFLVGFINPDNNLPKATYDLWEERIGQHTYSACAVYAGLNAAFEISQLINKKNYSYFKETAEKVKESISKTLYDDFGNRFFRGINSRVEGWGFEGHGGTKQITLNPKGYKRDVYALDIMVDACLLGVSVPFDVFDANDRRVVETVKSIEEKLTSHGIGGIRRYETDNYMGGNPWIVTTLWLALYYLKIGNKEKAKELLLWSAKGKNHLGLLPEQIDKDTHSPAWIIPLTWSHAMYILVYLGLLE